MERKQASEREGDALRGRDAAQSEAQRVSREAEAARLRASAEEVRLKGEMAARAATATAEADRLKAENDARTATATAEADRLKAENDARAASATAEANRLKGESDARTAAAVTEADRLKAENAAREVAAKSDADRLRLENEAQRAASAAALSDAEKQKAQLLAEKAELRILLLKQFNAILQTRDTARGLIVNMSDVLFDTAKSTLRPAAREKLAKVSGIVSGHPGLRLDVEGFTDSVGGDAYNQTLSEQRGTAVRDYLLEQGMAATSLSAKGFGKTRPVATNDTAAGRQQNRRVELVISGEVIGTVIGVTIAER
jgi:outer membrane protein OmpA-like peptidoglycan-associated protein